MKLYFLNSRRRTSGTPSDFVLDLRETFSIADGCKFRIDQLRLSRGRGQGSDAVPHETTSRA